MVIAPIVPNIKHPKSLSFFLECICHTDTVYSVPILLPPVPGSSPLRASSIAQLSFCLPTGLDDLSDLNEVERVRLLDSLTCVSTKALHARKHGGTHGRQAALRTKSFSIPPQIPMFMPSSASRQFAARTAAAIRTNSQSNMLMVGLPRRAVLETNLTTANAKELSIRKLGCHDSPIRSYLRKTKTHQGHCTELLPRRHLQAPDDNARIDGKGNVRERRNTCARYI